MRHFKKIKQEKTNKGMLLGIRKDGEKVWLSEPKWDCGWYWGFGYLGEYKRGRQVAHYHLSSQLNGGSSLENFESLTIEKDKRWTFLELAATAYALKNIAEVYGRGGSHYTTNPLAETIKNEAEVKRINEELLPAIFKEIENILTEEI